METTLTAMDIFWFLFSTATIGLLGIITWMAQRIVGKVDSIDEKVGAVRLEQVVTTQELHDHIENTGVHCKDGDCMYRRRLEDAKD